MNARILFVSHSAAVSGAERVMLNMAEAFVGAGAFLFEDGNLVNQLENAGFSVHCAQNNGDFSQARRKSSLVSALPMVGKLARILKELTRVMHDYDLLYANSQKAFTLSALAALMSGKPLIWHLHDIMNAAHFGAGQRYMQIALANRAAACIIAPSRAVADAFIAAGGRTEVRVIANGVTGGLESELDNPLSSTALKNIREALGMRFGADLDKYDTDHQKIIGIFSRLSPWKGQDVVLRALARLPDVRAVFAGAALFGEEAYADRLQKISRELGLSERILFLGHRSDVSALMRATDIVVHPSVDPEPFGLTLVEAMLAGVPLIASDAGASTEILENGRYGLLTPPGDDEALAQAIDAVFRIKIDRPADSAAMTQAARRHAQHFYSVARMNAAITATVAAIVNRSKLQ